MELSEPRALHRAASYCSKAERCESDVRTKLHTWGAPKESVERIIKRLKDEKFLSNERFCRSFINDKAKFNRWGEVKIRYELRKRNIPESVFEPYLEELPNEVFEEKLESLLKNKEPSVKGKTEYERKSKLIRFGLGRGYPMELVLKYIDKIINAKDEDMD